MVQSNTVVSGNVPIWSQFPVGVFPGCNAKTLRMIELNQQFVSFGIADPFRVGLKRF